MSSDSSEFRFGFVTVIGRPNVGKSTLVNRIVGQKISITSHRPQTTRHRILGIYTDDSRQLVLVDTPGIHSLAKKSRRTTMNRVINRTAVASIEGVDAICLMITAAGWSDADKLVLKALRKAMPVGQHMPVILLINKTDKLDSINQVLPLIEQSAEIYPFTEIYPLTLTGKGSEEQVARLIDVIAMHLPEDSAGFDSEQITDRSFRFLVSELIREQLFRRLGDELPYAAAVEISSFENVEGVHRINANIWVEKDSHKAMVIGKHGESLKKIGSAARKNCESLLEGKVFLELWVKVRSGWSNNLRDLYSLGYDESKGFGQ